MNIRHTYGFSIIELVLVISIMGILTVIAVPKIFNLITDVKEKAVTERLIEDLSLLRNHAINYRDTTWLVVDVGLNRYGLYSGPNALNRSLLTDSYSGDSALVDLTSEYEDVSISAVDFGGGSEVYFNWWGIPSSGGSITLNNSRVITLIAETGLAYEAP